MKFCFLMLVFSLFTKELNSSFSLPTIITTSPNFISINKCCLFKQFKDVYDSDTAILHVIVSKSDKTMSSFNTRTLPVLQHIGKS